MSLEQAQAFTKGLEELVTNFKAEEQALADEFKTYIQGAGAEFQEKSHTYAKESVEKVDQLATDIQQLYEDTYGDGTEEGGGGEELPPPGGGAPPDWNAGNDANLPSTGPVGPQPKTKK